MSGMWRKKDRLAGGRLAGCKERGEGAERCFMMQGAGRGVQVKSTIYKRRNGVYSLNVMGPQRKKYSPGTVDFFAILLIPVDDWYIIPFEVMGRTNSSIHFTPGGMRQKYERYLEAWHLLRETGLTIRACADPDWPEVGEPEVGESDTRVPRVARNDDVLESE